MLASVGTATSPVTDASSRAARLPGILLEWHNRSLQRLVHPACTAERLRPAHLTPPIPAPVPDRQRWRCRRHWQHPPPSRVSRVGSCNRLSELGRQVSRTNSNENLTAAACSEEPGVQKATIISSIPVPQVGRPCGPRAAHQSSGPPVVVDDCSTAVGASDSCTCN